MKTAFVSGGSGGIGSAICLELARNGYAVAVGYYKNEKAAADLCLSIRENDGVALPIKVDMCDAESISSAAMITSEQLGGVQVLVNCAGVASIGLFGDLSTEDIIRITHTDLIGAMLLTREFLPEMIKRHYGKVVNISSVWGESGASCETVYSAAKAGLIGFTKALAKETAPGGINVNCISAGFIDTQMNGSLTKEETARIIEDIPAGRAGSPQEIAKAVTFLVSDGAEYINGQTLRIDGGWL